MRLVPTGSSLERANMIGLVLVAFAAQTSFSLTLAVDEQIRVYHKLCKDLLDGYDRDRIPMRFQGVPINVTLYMWPYDILYVRWTDHYFMWNASDYNNISHVFLKAEDIWLPMVDIFYSKDNEQRTVQPCKKCYVKVDNDGAILSGFPFMYNFPCKINVKYFPFDRQTCRLELANWYLDETKMDLHPHRADVDLSVFLDNEEWDLTNIDVLRKSDYYNYGKFPILTYTLSIRRKPFYYVCNLCMPSLIIAVASLIGYHMPSTSTGIHQEKVKMGLTAILSIFILQLGIVDKMPRSSDVIPLISIFYFCLVSLLSIAILSSSLIILIEKQHIYGKPVPAWLRRLFLEKKKKPWCREKRRPCRHYDNGPEYGAFLHCTCQGLPANDVYSFQNHVAPEPQKLNRLRSELNHAVNQDSPCVWLNSAASLGDQPFIHFNSSPDVDTHTGYCVNQTKSLPSWHHKCSEKNNRGPCEHQKQWTKCLLQELKGLNSSVKSMDKFLGDIKYKNLVKSEWCRLADAVERCSLFCFFAGVFISVMMFIFHGWY